MPWDEEVAGATRVDIYLARLAAHARDLARATEPCDQLDTSIPITALDGSRSLIKIQCRDMVEPGSPFAMELAPPAGTDDGERFVAFTGRDPRAPLGRSACARCPAADARRHGVWCPTRS